MKKKLRLPKFKSENQEQNFWSKLDLTDYFTAADFESVSFPNLKPTTHAISIRMPEYLIFRLKEQANQLDIPYQSLMKEYIAEGITFHSGRPLRQAMLNRVR